MNPHHNPNVSPLPVSLDAAIPPVRNLADAPVQGAREAGEAGAQPSITAPANYIRPLRHGVDSVYVSFPGGIDPAQALTLQELKQLAQSTDERRQATAIYFNGDHCFTVSPRGRGRFAFVLEDNWFHLELSNATAGVLPLAHVQVRSEYLTAVGVVQALETLQSLVPEFGQVMGPMTLSRIDLFVDFVASVEPTAFPGAHWVKRCRKRDIHEDRDYVTGISFGAGNEVSARLYDKTRELEKSGKEYLKPLWAERGWEPGQTVWRMEFQVRREGLPEALKGPALDAVPQLGALWRYLTTEWLRLAVPQDDDNRSRWPVHPLWDALAQAWDVAPDASPLVRAEKTRPPSDDAIFKAGVWGLTSFMAREGLTGAEDGLGEFFHALMTYFDGPNAPSDERLDAYLRRKARAKARRYNVRVDDHDEG